MQELIEHLQSGSQLTSIQVEHAVTALVETNATDDLKAAFLQALREKGETANEIAGFALAMLARAVDPQIDRSSLPGPMIDICGTGGDQMHLFNVSTTSMFVLAAGGAVVVKHGNRAITSQCGGADVLEQLGIRIDLSPKQLRETVLRHGAGFVFAPNYHPAFKSIAPVRKLLAAKGIPTIFNMLGPLLNPARPLYQLVGVFSPSLLEKYAMSLAALGRHRAWAIHGAGLDELSLSAPSDAVEVAAGASRKFSIDPQALGLPSADIAELRGGDKEANARILLQILDGTDRGPKRRIVELNAAAGFVIAGLAEDLPAGLNMAAEQIDNGEALRKLHALRQNTV